MKNFKKTFLTVLALWVLNAQAQTPASAPYSPSWQDRHQLQLLVDQAGLALPLTHWPLPSAAVSQALDDLPAALPFPELETARSAVMRELQQRQQKGSMGVQLRQRSEGLNGFDENYTPGSSVQLVTSEKRLGDGDLTMAGRLGLKLEETSNALATNPSGMGIEGRYQARLEGAAAVLGWKGWNVQAFSHRHWWGPGWQSSLVNGANAPAWNGVGIQRGTTKRSESPWLSWMGPWNLDVFVARAQDPLLATNQAVGYLYSGARLTLKPQPWLEVGLSRGMQTGGQGRPSGPKNFVKAFLGQEVNQNPGDPADTSNQLAGYDVRVSCPRWMGTCAAYGQIMGEDAAGQYPPLPYRFMKLVGFEQVLDQGRHRVFVEFADTFTPSWPDKTVKIPGYLNGFYSQGYTNGARWIGSAQGGASRVTTLGWLDAERNMLIKLHTGRIGLSLGSYSPEVNAPKGNLIGLSAQRSFNMNHWTMTPELSMTKLSAGENVGSSKRNNVRLGVEITVPL